MKIENGIYMLEIESNTTGKPTTIYPTLISNNDSIVLVDTGFPGVFNQICEAVEKEGLELSKLDTIIFTHQDIDHIGNVSEILNKVSGNIKTFSHEEEKAYINGEKIPVKLAILETNLENLPDNMKAAHKMLKAGFQNNRVNIDYTLIEGQELPYCGGMTVIHTPGHTPGHICLYFKQLKVLIAGDIFAISDGLLMRGNQAYNFDNEENNKSIQKLMEYYIETVICYHGGMYNDNVNKRIAELVNGD
ncbi:MBL fold metallo-hydrolase [Clostridium sp. C2-6-12]|uniref:MBL fold metallo-hydrolase n=1 Tax=Clostridium sp. C2-6-12 TaxID=2698832 RepID=UPI00137117BA|nr:MBL fold metallo-hydrolase [Clostridium sp. C2-6-12]